MRTHFLSQISNTPFRTRAAGGTLEEREREREREREKRKKSKIATTIVIVNL